MSHLLTMQSLHDRTVHRLAVFASVVGFDTLDDLVRHYMANSSPFKLANDAGIAWKTAKAIWAHMESAQ